MELILRDKLAIDRTHLSNERTLLSYLRTSLYLIIFSLVIFSESKFIYIPIIGVIVSLFIAIIGLKRYKTIKKRIKSLYK